jgi:hypothetical protein
MANEFDTNQDDVAVASRKSLLEDLTTLFQPKSGVLSSLMSGVLIGFDIENNAQSLAGEISCNLDWDAARGHQRSGVEREGDRSFCWEIVTTGIKSTQCRLEISSNEQTLEQIAYSSGWEKRGEGGSREWTWTVSVDNWCSESALKVSMVRYNWLILREEKRRTSDFIEAEVALAVFR